MKRSTRDRLGRLEASRKGMRQTGPSAAERKIAHENLLAMIAEILVSRDFERTDPKLSNEDERAILERLSRAGGHHHQ